MTIDRDKLIEMAKEVGFGIVDYNDHERHVTDNGYMDLPDRAKGVSDEPIAKVALENAALEKRIAVLEDLLASAYNIANRNGENTHWQRFAGQLHVNGISAVTPKTFKILPSDAECSQLSTILKDNTMTENTNKLEMITVPKVLPENIYRELGRKHGYPSAEQRSTTYRLIIEAFEAHGLAIAHQNQDAVRVEFGSGLYGVHHGTLGDKPCLTVSNKGVGVIGMATSHENMTEMEPSNEIVTFVFNNKDSYDVVKKEFDSVYLASPQPQTVKDALEAAAKIVAKTLGVNNISKEIRALIK